VNSPLITTRNETKLVESVNDVDDELADHKSETLFDAHGMTATLMQSEYFEDNGQLANMPITINGISRSYVLRIFIPPAGVLYLPVVNITDS